MNKNLRDPEWLWHVDPETGILSIYDEGLRDAVQKMLNATNDEHEAALAKSEGLRTMLLNTGRQVLAERDEARAALKKAEEESDQWLRDIIAQAKDRIGTAAFGGGPYGPTVSLVRIVYDILDDPRLKYAPPTILRTAEELRALPRDSVILVDGVPWVSDGFRNWVIGGSSPLAIAVASKSLLSGGATARVIYVPPTKESA
jgi:hypothetical protein